jgi:predicted nucleotidyltransferase
MTKTIEYIIQKIVSGYAPDKIFLFGSYATGTATVDSDLDLLLIKETQVPVYQRSREVRKLLYGIY